MRIISNPASFLDALPYSHQCNCGSWLLNRAQLHNRQLPLIEQSHLRELRFHSLIGVRLRFRSQFDQICSDSVSSLRAF